MRTRAWKIALLLFGSGTCALVYQVSWLRELRLVFGASTLASAAVLAIFMGGLGVGGWTLGRRVDRAPRPLAFYARLELGVAASALLSPLLLWVVRRLYLATGGVSVLGATGASVERLVLAGLVLGVPTFLMGGTLPAAARAVETRDDASRRRLAALYGANTLGAVFGAALTTFALLEVFGILRSLAMAGLANLCLGVIGLSLSRQWESRPAPLLEREHGGPAAGAKRRDLPVLVLGAAFLVGVAFFVMELVWYRMLAPLLGGSTYTFGLILTVALLGIGIGGALASLLLRRRRTTWLAFATTCGGEALAMIVPYALGDRLAVLTLLLRPIGDLSFTFKVLSWSLVAGIVILPAAVIAGIQFPLLIGLLGEGERDVGRDVGLAYAWNTAGAIVGALVGGFGLLPLATAPGAWRLVTALLAALGLAAAAAGARTAVSHVALLAPLASGALAFALLASTGPTAAWRHQAIGAGRATLPGYTRHDITEWLHSSRASIIWEADGIESSVALDGSNGLAFIVNGKVDGNARKDASTQVMGGLISAALHPLPRRALVVGLGTGSTAGWLAAVPGMAQVDVVELEPVIAEVARACSAVNLGAMSNPKVRLTFNDARETLLTTPARYDLIVSEPSNPYRAGIASLYTREFYEAAAARLDDGGIFSQWVQAYEVDTQTVRTILATLASVFPHVEVWQTNGVDMFLICSRRRPVMDADVLRDRLTREPFRSAMNFAWEGEGLEVFMAHLVATADLAKVVARQEAGKLSTDDRMLVEYGFARTVGRRTRFTLSDMHAAVASAGAGRPSFDRGTVDWRAVATYRDVMLSLPGNADGDRAADSLGNALARALAGGRLAEIAALWRRTSSQPASRCELRAYAEALADAGDGAAAPLISRLRALEPSDSLAVEARLLWRQRHREEAIARMREFLAALRLDPWVALDLGDRTLTLAVEMTREQPGAARDVLASLATPFAANILDLRRRETALWISPLVGAGEVARQLESFEPNPTWTRDYIEFRAHFYAVAGHPLAGRAQADLNRFLADEAPSFSEMLTPRS